MSFVKIWVHAVWGTKHREHLLHEVEHRKVCEPIVQNALDKKIYIDCIDGAADHLHSLMTLNAEMSISKQMQLIKGESSYWINKNNILSRQFEWADEYIAVSVSEDKLSIVRAYILGQKEHHQKITFLDEYNFFLKQFETKNVRG